MTRAEAHRVAQLAADEIRDGGAGVHELTVGDLIRAGGPAAIRPEAQWKQWPADRPRPTVDEYAAADARFLTTIPEEYRRIPTSSLAYVMATFARPCWWEFFFPDEPLPFAVMGAA